MLPSNYYNLFFVFYRFVLLEDCNHCIENEGLMRWLKQSSESIGRKVCPRCKTPINKCIRFMNLIKKDMDDVQAIKQKVFFNKWKDLKKQQFRLIDDLSTLKRQYPNIAGIFSVSIGIIYTTDNTKHFGPRLGMRLDQLSHRRSIEL